MLSTGIARALLYATEKLDIQAYRVARHLADATRGDEIGAQALKTVSRTWTHADPWGAAQIAHSFDRSGTSRGTGPVGHSISVDGSGSGQYQPGFSIPDWKWDQGKVYRRWNGALAVRPNTPLVDGHLMVVADGPSGASVDRRMAYAAELAAEVSSANVITSRRGLDSDFGPIHVVPRKFGDGLKLPWTKQQEGRPHKELTEHPCGFCKVISGEFSAEVVRDWVDAMGIVPLDPVIPGKHQLVIPKEHVRDVSVDPEVSGAAMARMVEMTRDHPNVDINTSRGEPATQTAGHLHIHALIREEGDGLELMTNPEQPPG